MAESGAAKIAISLTHSGAIGKVVLCHCGKFFFKKFAHQRFCSDDRKLAEAQANPKKRAKRNAYARALYHLHKSGKIK